MPIEDIDQFISEKQKAVLGQSGREVEIDIVKGPGVKEPTSTPPKNQSFAERVRTKSPQVFSGRVKRRVADESKLDFARGFNAGLADMLDLPGRATAGIVNMIPWESLGFRELPTGGFRQIFEALNLTVPEDQMPDSAAASTGKFMGETAATLPLAPFGAGIKAQQTAQFGLRAGASGLSKQIGQSAVQRPATFAATELASGAGAGFLGFAAKENFPNSQVAEVWGNLAGGMILATPTLTGLVAKRVVDGARKLRGMRTETSAQQRMSKRIQESVVDKDAVIGELEFGNVLPGAELTPAQESGDPLLLALERAIIDHNTEFAVRSDEQLADLNSTIIDSMRARPESAEITRDTLEETRKYINALVDGRLKIATIRIKERLQSLESTATREQANVIAREEIEAALTASRQQENEIWGMVPLDVEASPSTVRKVWRDHLEEFSASRTGDPKTLFTALRFGPNKKNLQQLLGDFKKTSGRRIGSGGIFEEQPVRFVVGDFKDSVSIRELQQMRSTILREIRQERGQTAPNFNRIRILDDLQEAILNDMGVASDGAATEAGVLLQQALDFSAGLNKRFTKGPVGRILGMDKTGAPRAPVALTLETSIGGGGPRGKENFDRIMDAVRENPEQLKGAVENYIKSRFADAAVRNDSINISKAEGFLRQNKALLDQFPEIQVSIQKAVREENARFIRERKVKTMGARLQNPRISKAALYIQKDPEQAFQEIAKSRNPSGDLGRLVKLAQRDQSGEALAGLQESFMDWILQRSQFNSIDARRQKFVSGFLMDRAMNDPSTKMMANTLLSVDQKQRIEQAIETALKMEKALSAKASVEGVIDDVPHRILNDAMGIVGAQAGRVTARVTGGGTVQTPGIFARRARDLFKQFSKDNAEQLLIDAFMSNKSDKLLEALLMEIKTEADFKFVSRQLNAWLAVTAYEAGTKIPGTTQEND